MRCLCETEGKSPKHRITFQRAFVLFVCFLVPSISSQVEEKNNRIQEILVDLGSDETFFRPKWLDAEQPEEVFNVSELEPEGEGEGEG